MFPEKAEICNVQKSLNDNVSAANDVNESDAW